MATYNWAIRPGVTNKYGLTGDYCYIALFGNDDTGDGSMYNPYRTLNKAIFIGSGGPSPLFGMYVVGSGTYREGNFNFSAWGFGIVGDGDVTIDFSYYPYLFNVGRIGNAYNIKFIGNGSNQAGISGDMKDVKFSQCIPLTGGYQITNVNGCTFENITGTFGFISNYNTFINNCTFYNCNSIIWGFGRSDTNASSNIFVLCNIKMNTSYSFARYSLFFNCNFKLNNTSDPDAMPLYPSLPDGYTNYTDINTLISDFVALFPTAPTPFYNSVITDPLFNNKIIGDYTLQLNSPAKNLSYFGTPVGANSIAYSLKATTDSSSAFETDSAVNVTIADNSITIADITQDAQVIAKVLVNSLGREIDSFPIFGFNADRNGQYIDSIADLSTIPIPAGTALSPITPYLVQTGSINYNGQVYQPGERFTTQNSVDSFTTAVGGALLEIIEAPQRHTLMARFSNGSSSSLNNTTTLIVGYYYYVVSGTATYNGNAYNVGDVFKCVLGATIFTGTALLITAFTTEAFQHYEVNAKPTTNNTGDTRNGDILIGSGDPSYSRGGLNINEFPISQQFIQVKYIIRVNDLKP